MRRTIFALTGTLALLALAPPASATEPEYGVTTTTITPGDECGTATITWTNPTPWEFTGDYKLVGEGGGTPDEMTGQTIAEGPLAGKPFGKLYDPQPVPANGDQVSKTLTFEEDAHDGKVKVMAWVKRGPEQMSFSAGEARVDTDCEAPVEPSEPPTTDPTEPTVEPTESPTTEPSTDPSETDAPTTEPTDDEDVDGDKANDDGSAPTPVPQPAHLAVTG